MKVKKEEVKEEVKREFTLIESFVLWKNKSKDGKAYVSGYTSGFDKEGNEVSRIELIGFYNTNKLNPKQPDIRIYAKDDKEHTNELISLWDVVSNNDKRYLSGKTNEDEKLVGFYAKDTSNQKPDIRVYYKENKTNDNELPF